MSFRLAAFTGVWQVLWVLNGSIVALCKSGDPPRTSGELELVQTRGYGGSVLD